MDWPNFEVAPGEGKYKKLKLSTYKFCKTTGTLDGETKEGLLTKHRSVLGYDQVGHIPGNARIWDHMVKPGVWGINANNFRKLGGDLMNLLPDPGEKG